MFHVFMICIPKRMLVEEEVYIVYLFINVRIILWLPSREFVQAELVT